MDGFHYYAGYIALYSNRMYILLIYLFRTLQSIRARLRYLHQTLTGNRLYLPHRSAYLRSTGSRKGPRSEYRGTGLVTLRPQVPKGRKGHKSATERIGNLQRAEHARGHPEGEGR